MSRPSARVDPAREHCYSAVTLVTGLQLSDELNAKSDSVPSRPLSVLLVEDEWLIRMNCAEMLQDMGHNVIEASTAEEAMASLASGPADILITDVTLPGASGTKLAERARELFPDIGVVFATGRTEPSLTAGLTDVVILQKPYDSRGLARAVAAATD